MTGTSVYVMRGREVVLKRLDDDCLLDGRVHPNIAERLNRVRELPLTGVANFIGVEIVGGEAQLVWEFVAGTNLEETRGDAATWERLAREVILGVMGLHSCGIVHGGIHAANVIVTPSGAVRLTHVSPLLYHEEGVDVEAVKELLGEMGFESEGTSVKELAEGIRRSGNESGEGDGELEGEHLRKWALIGAIVAALVGAGVAWMLWKNAEKQPAREAQAWDATRYLNRPHPNPLTEAEGTGASRGASLSIGGIL